MTFSITTKNGVILKDIMKHVKSLFNNVHITFDFDGMQIKSSSDNKDSHVDISLPKDKFDNYEVEEVYKIHVDTEDFYDKIENLTKDDTLTLNRGDSFYKMDLVINDRYNYKIRDLDHEEDPPEFDRTNFKEIPSPSNKQMGFMYDLLTTETDDNHIAEHFDTKIGKVSLINKNTLTP